MIGAIFGLLSAGAGRTVAIGLAALALAGVAWGGLTLHDRAVRAELLAGQQAAAASAEQHLHEATVAAFGRLLADQQAAAAADARTLQEIAHAPVTTGCASSPAVAAALRGLQRAGAGDGSAGGSGADAVLPGGAGGADRAE